MAVAWAVVAGAAQVGEDEGAWEPAVGAVVAGVEGGAPVRGDPVVDQRLVVEQVYVRPDYVCPDYMRKLWSLVDWTDVTRRFDAPRAGTTGLIAPSK